MPNPQLNGAVMLARASIRRDGGTQPRAALNDQAIAEYAEALDRGEPFPAATVFYDGSDYWLADGFHRDGAHARLGWEEMACDVRAGTRRDAVLFACGANEAHGLRRSNEDKRRAVLILLGDAEWMKWSDSEIARRARVSHTFVAKLRPVTCNVSSERTFRTKHGVVATMDTAAIGQSAATEATARALDVNTLYRAFQMRGDVKSKLIKDHRAEQQQLKRDRREEREQELGERIAAANAALPAMAAAQRVFGVFLADPAWRPEPYSRDTGMDRAPDNHYPTMPTSEIAALPVGALAARDSVLFLWATMQMLQDAFVVIDAWGFTYKSHAIWVKRRAGRKRGPGYWFTGEHEVLIVAVRGDPPCPAPGLQWPSVFVADIGEHSEKPDRVYELIEAYFPTVPKLELNARVRREGWESWGAEVPDAPPGVRLGRPQPEEIDAWKAEAPAHA